jgi:hypothetical protein
MGKGNWERRAELANVKRLEAKERKNNRGIKKSEESMIRRIINIATSTRNMENYKVWIENDPENGTVMCQFWLRTDNCQTKRCRLSHEISLGHLSNITLPSNIEEITQTLLHEIFLNDLEMKDIPKVQFISCNNICIFDRYDSSIWDNWIHIQNEIHKKETTSNEFMERKQEDNIKMTEFSSSLPRISENEVYFSSTSNENITKESDEVTKSVVSASPVNEIINDMLTSKNILSYLFLYLTYYEIQLLLISTNHIIKNTIISHIYYKEMKKSYDSMLLRELNKKKKDEKKKKIINANIKKVTSKKDGFARGGKGG